MNVITRLFKANINYHKKVVLLLQYSPTLIICDNLRPLYTMPWICNSSDAEKKVD